MRLAQLKPWASSARGTEHRPRLDALVSGSDVAVVSRVCQLAPRTLGRQPGRDTSEDCSDASLVAGHRHPAPYAEVLAIRLRAIVRERQILHKGMTAFTVHADSKGGVASDRRGRESFAPHVGQGARHGDVQIGE